MSNFMNHPQNERSAKPGDDLLWTAYQYTADELPEPAARAFEASLETDQLAREALAEAVSLNDTVRAALGQSEPEPELVSAPTLMPASLVALGNVSPSGVSYGWARSIAWVALGAAACLLLTMALRTTPPGNVPGADPVAAKPAVK